MSSRSLVTARAKRTGETAPPVSGNRPGTSIGSHANFSQQQPNQQPNQQYQQQPNQQYQQPNQQQRLQQNQQQRLPQNNGKGQLAPSPPPQNQLPFTKLTISDAIGLITLRLGRVEQWVIETDHENDINASSGSSDSSLPENSQVIDTSVLTSIINRLDALEKKELVAAAGCGPSANMSSEVSALSDKLARFCDEGTKHSLAISKHTEQLFKFEREFIETKDILKSFMMKYDLFATEMNDKLQDYDTAMADLEKNVHVSESILMDTSINNIDIQAIDGSSILSGDLKTLISQELSTIN
jgi:hypothetical protein